MQKTIYILRSAPYDYYINKLDLYDSFDLVAKRLVDPGLDKSKIKDFSSSTLIKMRDADLIVSAPEKRSIQTAKLIGKDISQSKLLSDVRYSMGNFIDEAEFYRDDGSPDVQNARKRFVNALLTGNTDEKYALVISRIERILDKVSNTKGSKIVLVSHGFIMKILEAYVRDNSIKQFPGRLKTYFTGESETFKFGEGLVLEEKNGKFRFVSYISN